MEGEEQLGIEERNVRLEGGWDGEKKGRVLRKWKKGDAVVVWSRAAIRSELWSGLVGGFLWRFMVYLFAGVWISLSLDFIWFWICGHKLWLLAFYVWDSYMCTPVSFWKFNIFTNYMEFVFI